MRRSGIALAGLLGLLLCSQAAEAQVDIKVPFVRVSTGGPGGGVYVRAPFVTVNVPPKYPAFYPTVPHPSMPQADPTYVIPPQQQLAQGQVVVPQQQPPVIVQPQQPQPLHPPTVIGPPLIVNPRPAILTHREFAKIFVPIPGKHQVTLIHPGSGCPVDVCFDLPPGCPKVHVGHRYIEFDYGRCEVEIRFALFGKVRVEYDD